MSVRPPSDSSPTDHDAALDHRTAEGAILLPDGRRVAAWPEIFLRTLHRELADTAPEATRQVLYRAGFEWGLQELLLLSQRLREELRAGSNLDLWHLDAAQVLARWSAPLAIAGWGTWTFDRTARASGVTVVELRHSAVVAALAASAGVVEPVCHLYAGLFAGALSFYDRMEVHAVETACAALGNDVCRFIVAPGPLVDRAETARHSGATHEAILSSAVAPPAAPAKAAKIPWGKK
jgi:hypothetical protein